MRLRAVVLDDYQAAAGRFAAWESLPDSRISVDFSHVHHASADRLVSALQPYDVVILMRERTVLDRSVVERLPRLKLVITTAMHNRVLDVEALREQGITICGTRSLLASTVEHSWALILAAARHVPTEDANIRTGRWQTTVGVALAGKVLGLVGLGKLGSRMIPIARAFGMQVIGWSPHLDESKAVDLGIEKVGKKDLFERSDVVSIHMVLSESTRGLMGAEEFAVMKKDAILVNTSRGGLVDERSLVEALETKRIGSAALDVFPEEPLPSNSPLRTLPNSVLTPHIGFVTDAEYRIFFEDVVEDLHAYLDGSPIRVVTT